MGPELLTPLVTQRRLTARSVSSWVRVRVRVSIPKSSGSRSDILSYSQDKAARSAQERREG